VATSLNPGAYDREYRSVGLGETIRGHRRDGRRAHLGNKPSVHANKRFAALGLEEKDGRMVGWHLGVARVEGDELRAQG
jgi:hypothetical protein